MSGLIAVVALGFAPCINTDMELHLFVPAARLGPVNKPVADGTRKNQIDHSGVTGRRATWRARHVASARVTHQTSQPGGLERLRRHARDRAHVDGQLHQGPGRGDGRGGEREEERCGVSCAKAGSRANWACRGPCVPGGAGAGGRPASRRHVRKLGAALPLGWPAACAAPARARARACERLPKPAPEGLLHVGARRP